MPAASLVPSALRRPVDPPLNDRAAWSLQDTARALGLSIRTVQHLVRRGELPVARIGRRLLFSPERIRAWLESRQTTTSAG